MRNGEYTVPAELRTILALVNPKSRCVHCGVPLFSRKNPKDLPPDFSTDKNGLDELIVWCECRSCGKISSIAISQT